MKSNASPLPRTLILLAALLLAVFSSARAAQLRVVNRGASQAHVDTVKREMPRIVEEITYLLDQTPPETITVELVNSASFTASVGERRGEWALAVAIPSRARILINTPRLDLRNNLVTTLQHEMVHLVLGRVEAKAGRSLPLWFHEGVAQWAAQNLFYGTRDEFLAAAAAGRLFPLSRIEKTWPLDGHAANVAYAQSEDFIAFLEREHPQAVQRILAYTARGIPFSEAFSESCGASLSEKESAWLETLDDKSGLLVRWLQDNPSMLWVLILGGGGVLLFLAWLRYRARRRALFEKWATEEPWNETGDDDEPDEFPF